MRALYVLSVCLSVAGLLSCDSKPKRNPFDSPASAAVPAPKVTAPPKPEGPPQLKIDGQGPKVGWTLLMLDKAENRRRFTAEMHSHRQHFDGRDVKVSVDRKAHIGHVVAMLDELHANGAAHIQVVTETRTEFPGQLEFVPQQRVPHLPSCTVVMMILQDRATAVWKVSGGTASRRGKGLAGPDLSTTAETIKRYAKRCDASSTMLVSGAEGIEWGLVYDLASSAQRLKGVKWSKVVLLREVPVAGRPVKLH
ncbi:ExbD/TolR family protein [Myxococcota bacterium]